MSSRQSNKLYCALRRTYVQDTPEERVRQSTLSSLFSLGFLPSLTAVERKIDGMPKRRIDILCYESQTLKPLLLIECKAKAFSDKELRQLLGYNFYVQAKFVALVSCDKTLVLNTETNEIFNSLGCIKSFFL